MSRSRLVAVSLAWALAALSPMPALADDQVMDPDPRAVTLPSFTESPGCDGPYGVGGPYATHSGYLAPDEPVLGPWGGFFGRTMEQVHAQLVLVELPMADRPFTLYVHERVVPALQRVIVNLEREAAAGRRYTIRADFTSSYNPITIPGRRHLSYHTVGAAIDVNSDTNPYRADNVLVTDMPEWFVKAWTDAGWCWGGDWRDAKDPMHFSWRGPLYASGDEVPAPFPPLTGASSFRTVISFATALREAPSGSIHLVADMDRDGSPDVVRLRAWTAYGHLGVEAAVGKHDYETCLLHDITVRPPRARAGYALTDWTGNGRPDLWAFDASGDSVRVEVYRWDSRYRKRAVITPEVSSEGVVALLAGDHDRDGRSDLYVVRAGSPGSVEVWAG
ncbi:MAG TPA: M15 family metallopeptidase, partial [Phycisphaerae bacterium]|nr:M15 family metallopeptidase [Phycisphaerae bacterium]